jgi:hypothetical protein
VQSYSLSDSLPVACKRLNAVFVNAPNTLRVEYLLARCADRKPFSKVLTRALRFPACTIHVLDVLLRDHITSANDRTADLPRRIFKDMSPRTPSQPPWHAHDAPLPYLRHLFRHLAPDVNANDGYALTRAVYAGHTPLVRFLLDHGADPACKGSIAVLIAIRRRDKEMVRTLIERDYVPPIAGVKRRLKHAADLEEPMAPEPAAGGGRAKKRKLGDRIQVSKEMLRAAQDSGAEELMDYFLSEKGCVPDIKTLGMMGTGLTARNRSSEFISTGEGHAAQQHRCSTKNAKKTMMQANYKTLLVEYKGASMKTRQRPLRRFAFALFVCYRNTSTGVARSCDLGLCLALSSLPTLFLLLGLLWQRNIEHGPPRPHVLPRPVRPGIVRRVHDLLWRARDPAAHLFGLLPPALLRRALEVELRRRCGPRAGGRAPRVQRAERRALAREREHL